MVEKKFRWCERRALRHGRFPAQAPVLKDQDDARGGTRRHGRFPPQARTIEHNIRK